MISAQNSGTISVTRDVQGDPRSTVETVSIAVAIETDAPLLRGQLTSLFAAEWDLRLVDADDAALADVVLVDLTGSRAAGLVACAAIKARDANQAVIVLDGTPDPAALRAAIRAGADGYLSQRDDLPSVAIAVRTVHAGGAWVPSRLLPTLVVETVRVGSNERRATSRLGDLSPRERDVLSMLAAGATQAAIADRLFISSHTVRTHVRNVLRKVGARTRVEAVALALDAGLIDLER